MSDKSTKTIIQMWSAPRSLSTATMYSFANRPDTVVLDEPLYASYLSRNPHIFRPYRDELINSQLTDGNEILTQISKCSYLENTEKNILFCKHMSKHLDGLNSSLIVGENIKHIILIRNPLSSILSWEDKASVHQEQCSLATLGLLYLINLYSEIKSSTGISPIVLDSDLLQQYPSEIIKELCERLDIPFSDSQLSWKPGPKPIDGIWAKYWYASVWQSSQFTAKTSIKYTKPLTPAQLNLYRECLPFYQFLYKYAVGVDPLNPGSSVVKLYLPLTWKQNIDIDDRLADQRNKNTVAWVGSEIVPRELAKVSVFDSAVQGGDAVWEGLRIYNGRVFMLDTHIDRLMNSAKAIAFENVPSKAFIVSAVRQVLILNDMLDGAHIRLTLTRGPKISSSMNPKFNLFGTNLIVLPEFKSLASDPTIYSNDVGVSLITATGRRNSPQTLDSKIHHNNLINNILPKIQANLAGAADALMLDTEGFVSETNATNVFLVKRGQVFTPHADYCLPGVTRGLVISIVRDTLKLNMIEKRLSLFEFHTADEVFTTGTMGEITPVRSIDGRIIGSDITDVSAPVKIPGEITALIQVEYRKLTETLGTPIFDV